MFNPKISLKCVKQIRNRVFLIIFMAFFYIDTLTWLSQAFFEDLIEKVSCFREQSCAWFSDFFDRFYRKFSVGSFIAIMLLNNFAVKNTHFLGIRRERFIICFASQLTEAICNTYNDKFILKFFPGKIFMLFSFFVDFKFIIVDIDEALAYTTHRFHEKIPVFIVHSDPDSKFNPLLPVAFFKSS